MSAPVTAVKTFAFIDAPPGQRPFERERRLLTSSQSTGDEGGWVT